jgi:diguanylate cyclase (GGDEF)-like protein
VSLGYEDDEDGFSRTSQTAIKISPVKAAEYAVLTVLTGLSAGQAFTLRQVETIIGRGRDCGVKLDDQGISRRHCRVVGTVEGGYLAEDLESTNGTYVNGKRHKRAKLKPGDRLQIGPDVVLRLTMSDETEEALAKKLYESSTRDPLTFTNTRKYFDERLEAEIAYARRHKTPLGVLMIDVDHFKVVNDTYGHATGDIVLRRVAQELQNVIRTEDTLARYGGEEFVVLVRGIKPRNVIQFAERVRRAIERLDIRHDGKQVGVTVSVGVAMLADCGQDQGSKEIVGLADERLYRAKRAGRNRTCAG